MIRKKKKYEVANLIFMRFSSQKLNISRWGQMRLQPPGSLLILMDGRCWSYCSFIIMMSGESQPDRPHPPLDHWALSTVCSRLHHISLPPSCNPAICARQADHLTTNATATEPSPSNVKPGWNVALTTQTHGKGRGGGGGSNWYPTNEEQAMKEREGRVQEL